MAKKEKFGKFVLLEQVDTAGLGAEYRAAKLGPTGLEKIVSVVRLNTAISGHPDVAKSLMDQAKVAAQLQNPNIVKIYGIGKVESSYYISYEFIEGKSLKAVFGRCRQDGFPFSVDHTLLIASKICAALEYAHGRKGEGGGRYFHGLLTPSNVFVSYEGEVRVRGFGYWPGRVRDAGLTGDDTLYLAPEQAGSDAGDTRSDIFAVGALLFESLTGHPLFEGGRSQDPASRVAKARLQNPTGDDDSLPKPLAEILQRALAADPGGRYPEIQEMRKAIDTLLFSGDFTPTTFNLAFFMHSLFREEIERESKALKEERDASYFDFLTEEPARAAGGARPGAAVAGAGVALTPPPGVPNPFATPSTPVTTATPVPHFQGAPAARTEPDARHAPAPVLREDPPVRERTAGQPAAPASSHGDAGISAKEAAAGFTFHKDEPKSRMPIFAGLGAVLAAAAVGGYMLTRPKAPAAPSPAAAPISAPSTLSAEALAAMEKVKELEGKLRKIEEDNAAAAAKAQAEAKKRLEDQARARGEIVDQAQLARAQEEARRRAEAEQERRAQEERRRLEEQKRAEEARIAEEERKAQEAARLAALAATTTLPAATQPPATSPPTTVALRAGTLVNLSDAGVVPPVPERAPQVQYPPIAQRQRVEGTVELNVLVDERGNVVDHQIVAGAGGRSGLNEAAVENVRRRKYRPATKDGVPVKVWIPVRVTFKLP